MRSLSPIILLCIITAAVALAGCGSRVVYVQPLLPILPHPERPRLERVAPAELAAVSPEVKARLLARDAALKEYGERYRAIVDEYNAWADEQNRRSGFGDGEKGL